MIVLLTLLTIVNAIGSDKITGHFVVDGDGPTVDWSIDRSMFEATLTMKRPVAWISLGISPSNGLMAGSDALIAVTVGKTIYRVQLGASGDESRVFQTLAEAYADGSIIQNGGGFVFNIRRPLDTDQAWQVPISQNQPTTLIVAWRFDPSPSGLLGIHSGHHSQTINNNGTTLAREEAKVAPNDVSMQFNMPNTGLQVSYSIHDNHISFDVVANSQTWIGIGFAERFAMNPSLAIIGQNPNHVQAYLINSMSVNSADPQLTNELSKVSFQSSNGKSRLQFTRPLQWAKSGLSSAYNVNPNGDSIIISATGGSTTLAKHTATDLAKVSWNSAAKSTQGSSMQLIIIAHGGMMILAWLFLMPIGAMIARYFRDAEFRWFRFHRALMLSAVAFTVLSFILIVWARAGRLFDSTHGAIGFFIVFLASLQVLLTFCRNKARAIWKLQHRSTSVILYLAALVNCYIGASMLGRTSINVTYITIITLLLVLGFMSIIVLEMKRGRSSHQAETDIREEDANQARAFG